MFTRPRASLALCLLLSASACKGGDPVQELCELALSCPCSMPPYATVEACVADFNAQVVDPYKSFAEANGLTYDQGCLEREVGIVVEIGCGIDVPYATQSCSFCALVHGDKPVGAACVDMGLGSECASNLFCLESTCVDLCARLGAGETCAETETDFTVLGNCADDLYCDYNQTNTCKPFVGLGGDCTGFGDCKPELVCGADNKCANPPGAGDPCSFTCAEGLTCEDSVCAALPGEGEPCTAFTRCGAGLECDSSELCVAAEPLVCKLSSDD